MDDFGLNSNIFLALDGIVKKTNKVITCIDGNDENSKELNHSLFQELADLLEMVTNASIEDIKNMSYDDQIFHDHLDTALPIFNNPEMVKQLNNLVIGIREMDLDQRQQDLLRRIGSILNEGYSTALSKMRIR